MLTDEHRKKRVRRWKSESYKMKEKGVKKRGRPPLVRPPPPPLSKSASPEDGPSDMILSDNPREICLMKCEICGAPVKCMRAHAMSHHHLSAKEYHAFYPEVKYKRKTYHRYGRI